MLSCKDDDTSEPEEFVMRVIQLHDTTTESRVRRHILGAVLGAHKAAEACS